MSMGRIYEPSAMLLRQYIGEADGDGKKYEMALINGHTPAVKSLATGKTFALGWDDILRLGIESGVDV